MKTVGEVSELSGVSVRTLHHYDELGLLSPSERSGAGYRLYAEGDLERLQELLGWRALGFSLAEIKELLDDPDHHRGRALRAQRELVDGELERLAAMARALDVALAAHEKGAVRDMTHMFDGLHPADHDAEVRERWGDSEAFAESARRTAAYGEQEWSAIRTEWMAVGDELAELLRGGEPPDGPQARAAAERHRRHIARWFHPCEPDMHRRLAAMYVDDPRFAARYDAIEPGLAVYTRDAIIASADGSPAVSG